MTGETPEPETPTPMPAPKPRTPNLALRRLKAGFKPSRGQAIVAVVLALVGCVAVVQVRVNRADDGYQNARREDLIAHLVPEGVVDQLEAVQVEEQHGELGAGPLVPVDRAGQPVQEQPAVRQAREGVVQGAPADLLLQPA